MEVAALGSEWERALVLASRQRSWQSTLGSDAADTSALNLPRRHNPRRHLCLRSLWLLSKEAYRNQRACSHTISEVTIQKGSKKFEQEEAIQKVALEVRPTTSFPRDKKESKKFEQELANQRAPPTARPMSTYSGRGSGAGTASVAASSEVETMADAWEKEKLAKIKKQYDEMMKTIAEWEAEKKAKAMRQKELKERDLKRKREKALEECNDEMRRISKVATASRLTAEERRRNAESKVKEKAERIQSTRKLPV